jgi:cytochrome b subunit of formate dehydrogenase
MTEGRITRHKVVARLMHWLMAIAILVLLATGLLPILGVKFDWTMIHWVAGLTLAALVLIHIIRSLFSGHFWSMGLGWRDMRAFFAMLGGGAGPKPGKYTLPQKLMHHAITLAALTGIGTGILMLRKLDTPFWKREPYFLTEQSWGIVYVFHDLATFTFVTLIMLHIYFTVRPEKFFYLRSMILGWIRRDEFEANHDPRRWKVPEIANTDASE